MTPDEQLTTLNIINDELRKRRDDQRSSSNLLETKSVVLLGVAATAAQVLIGVNRHGNYVLAAYSDLGLSFLLSVATLFPRKHQEVPRAESLATTRFANLRPTVVLAELIGTRREAIVLNAKTHYHRAILLRLAAGTLVVGLVLSSVAFGVERS